MSQVITAVFESGVLKPEEPLNLPPGARVRLIVESVEGQAEREKAWKEFDQLCEEVSIDSGGHRLSRDELHERR